MVQNLLHSTGSRINNTLQSCYLRTIIIKFYCDDQNKTIETKHDQKQHDQKQQNDQLPEPPTTCCMSGCANCVWIEYAEKLTNYFKDGGVKAKNQIMNSVTDPNMRAFLMTELRNIQK